MRSIATKYEEISAFSGKPKECDHHLIFGTGMRPLADADGLWIPLLDREHNMSSKGTIHQIHGNPAAEKLSKMLGEVVWERQYLAEKLAYIRRDGLDYKDVDEWKEEAREKFRSRYGQNFL